MEREEKVIRSAIKEAKDILHAAFEAGRVAGRTDTLNAVAVALAAEQEPTHPKASVAEAFGRAGEVVK